MSLHTLTLKEPIYLVSRSRRHLPPTNVSPPRPPTPRRILAGTTSTNTTGTSAGSSAVLAALDTHFGVTGVNRGLGLDTSWNDSDDSIEVIGPVIAGHVPPRQKEKDKNINATTTIGSGSVQRSLGKTIHPFFVNPCVAASTRSKVDTDTSTITAQPQTKPKAARAPKVSTTTLSGATDTTESTGSRKAKAVQKLSSSLIRTPNPILPPSPDSTIGRKEKSTKQKAQSTRTNLPKYSYKSFTPSPAVVYVRNEEEANDLVGMLRGPIGFDTEWRVFFTRSKASPAASMTQHRTSVVQVSDERMILIIQVYDMTRFPQKLKDLIESKDIVKTGANILNDGAKLFKDYGIVAHNLVELGALARQADPGNSDSLFLMKNGKVRRDPRGIASLAKVVEKYCGMTLVKPKERTSNWEAELNEKQIEYAANDAHSGLMAYKKLVAMAETNSRVLTPAVYTSSLGSTVSGLPSEDEDDEDEGDETQNQEQDENETVGATSTKPGKDPKLMLNVLPLTHRGMRPQYWRAYRMWHGRGMSLEEMKRELSSEDRPLKGTTVISYVIGALQADTTLAFDMKELRSLVQMEQKSWTFHKEWILSVGKDRRGMPRTTVENEGKGNMDS